MKTLDLFDLPLYWEMVNAEKIALLNLLSDVKPSIAIEIGTRKGGSLQLIAAMSQTVYCLDIDPQIKELSTAFPNANFIIGDSKETLPELLKNLKSKTLQPDFILVDGDHSSEGVKKDIGHILAMEITKPLVVLMHDSFNPGCRNGMLEIDYEKNPYVVFVDIDFVQGIYSTTPTTRGEMWGGFGLIYLDQSPKREMPLVKQSGQYSYERMYHLSKHFHLKSQTIMQRVKSYLFRKMFI